MQNDTEVTEFKKVGRPKSVQIKVRQYFYITKTELKTLQAVASVKQLSVSAIVRQVLLDTETV